MSVCTAAYAGKVPRSRSIESNAEPVVQTINGSPLTVLVGSDTAFQVINSAFPGSGQIFFTECTTTVADAGIFLATGGALYAPDFENHSCPSFVEIGPNIPWTPVSISPVTGSGTSLDPFRVVVVVDAGSTGIRMTAAYTYVNGENFFRISKNICVNGAAAFNTYVGADFYLADDDAGIPFVETASGSPGGKDCNNGGYTVLLVPTSVADRYVAGGFDEVWIEIGTRGDLSNTVGNGCIDNGAAVQWRRSLSGNSCTTITSAVSFGAVPQIAIFRVDAVTPNRAAPGQTVDVTITGVGFQSATGFDFGPDITVSGVTVTSSTQTNARLAISASATPGFRNVIGTQALGGATSTLTNGFEVAAPSRISFVASPSTIRQGQSTTLVFATENATSVSIDNGVNVTGTSGSVTVSPTQTTTYTLTARGADGSTATAQVTVTVITTPAVTVSAFPQGLLQSPNVGGATDRVTFTNVGGSPTTISLTQSGSFFSIAPTSLTLAAGANGTVTITAGAHPTGTYDGAIIASGAGIQATLSVPVRLLVSASPVGTVAPTPQTNRVDVTQPTGTLQITNSGTATLQGILISDVPWLIPQGGIVTIPPGQTITVSFTIDRSKRPDGASPIGSVTGFLTLVYLDGTQPAQGRSVIEALNGGAPSQSTKVQVVDLAAPATSMSAIPPLASGEIALFLPGLAKKANLVSDVTLVNTAITPLANLRLFFAGSGQSTANVQQASVSSLIPSGKALFSDVVTGVFGRPVGQVGGVQVRGTNASRLNLAAVVTNPTNASGLFSGSIASQRSDTGATANQKTVLPGVRKDSGARTDVYIQEVAGQAGSVRTDFLAEDGTVPKSRTDSIGAFAMLELANEAPSGAVAVSVTNLGTSSRIVAQGIVFDEQSGDATNLVDWNRRNGTAASDTQVILFASAGVSGGKRTRTDVWITNIGTTTATGTLTYFGGTSRRRSVVRPSSGSSARQSSIQSMASPKTITVEAGRTRVLRDVLASEFGSSSGSGYLTYTPTSATVAISSGTFRDPISASPQSLGSSGTSVPVLAASTGLKLGETRQFISLEDASAATVATAERATYRTGFGLIETSGKSATVKVTLRYQATVPGGLASAPVSNTKQYTLAPRQAMTVSEIGKEIFGAGRDSQGDLHDLVLEISVTGGDGRVIPYVLATENGSGDTIMKIE